MAKGIHDGHRQRMKDQFIRNGLSSFNSHQIVELLLFYSIPREDTNETAHRLIDRFGSLNSLFLANRRQLLDVDGIGENSATLLQLIGQLIRRCGEEERPLGSILKTPSDYGKFLLPRFLGEQNEVVWFISMTNTGEVLNCAMLNKGSVNATEINIRLALQQALEDNATMAVIAHNHPSGFAIPSKQDIATTRDLFLMLYTAGVTLLDHIIVADNDFVSMRESPMLKYVFTRPERS